MNIVRAQVASKEREGRISQLTLTEIQALPADKSKLYKGVGKMCVCSLCPVSATVMMGVQVRAGDARGHHEGAQGRAEGGQRGCCSVAEETKGAPIAFHGTRPMLRPRSFSRANSNKRSEACRISSADGDHETKD